MVVYPTELEISESWEPAWETKDVEIGYRVSRRNHGHAEVVKTQRITPTFDSKECECHRVHMVSVACSAGDYSILFCPEMCISADESEKTKQMILNSYS